MLLMHRWKEHLISAKVTQAYRDRGDVNGVAPNMRWEVDDEAVKGLIMSSILALKTLYSGRDLQPYQNLSA